MAKLSRSEVESRLESKNIRLERAPILGGGPISENKDTINHMIQKNKQKYPNFKESMWYYHYFTVDNITYSISYDWTSNSCDLITIDNDAIKKNPDDLNQFLTTSNAKNISKESIKMRHCELLYNFYAPSR